MGDQPWRLVEEYENRKGNKAQLGWAAAVSGSFCSAEGKQTHRCLLHYYLRWMLAEDSSRKTEKEEVANSNKFPLHYPLHRLSWEETAAEGNYWRIIAAVVVTVTVTVAEERVAVGIGFAGKACT